MHHVGVSCLGGICSFFEDGQPQPTNILCEEVAGPDGFGRSCWPLEPRKQRQNTDEQRVSLHYNIPEIAMVDRVCLCAHVCVCVCLHQLFLQP